MYHSMLNLHYKQKKGKENKVLDCNDCAALENDTANSVFGFFDIGDNIFVDVTNCILLYVLRCDGLADGAPDIVEIELNLEGPRPENGLATGTGSVFISTWTGKCTSG